LRRALQKFVESPLSKQLLSGDFSPGDIVQVDVDEENGTLTFIQQGDTLAEADSIVEEASEIESVDA
jgi:hypothetical protein